MDEITSEIERRLAAGESAADVAQALGLLYDYDSETVVLPEWHVKVGGEKDPVASDTTERKPPRCAWCGWDKSTERRRKGTPYIKGVCEACGCTRWDGPKPEVGARGPCPACAEFVTVVALADIDTDARGKPYLIASCGHGFAQQWWTKR